MNDAPVPNIYNTEDISGGTFDTPKKEVPQYSRREILLSAAVAVLSFLFVKYIIFNITGLSGLHSPMSQSSGSREMYGIRRRS